MLDPSPEETCTHQSGAPTLLITASVCVPPPPRPNTPFSSRSMPLLPRTQQRYPEVIRSKGLEKITVEDLVGEITPRGRATVPDAIKAELLQRIRKFLQE